MDLNNFQKYSDCIGKRVLLTGGTGFIGRRLVEVLLNLKCKVTVLTRNPEASEKLFQGQVSIVEGLSNIGSTAAFDVVINLAGEPLAEKRWNAKRKQEFINSRVQTTASICDLLSRLKHQPDVLINGSAIGFYGPHGDDVLTEESAAVDCFSHNLCRRWEEQALQAKPFVGRVCLLRIGIVLGQDGGPLKELLQPYKFGVSTQISSGQQWMSWIHRDDLIAMVLHLICEPKLSGPINGTAPNPVTNAGFADVLEQCFRTFIRVRVPTKILSLLVGELADEVLITGQKVLPTKIENSGFVFEYSQLIQAIEDIVGAR
ncbi:TIGR01777 family oxidoreductase [Aurantivibrio plasticivorans]